MNLFIILGIIIVTLIGCKAFEIYEDNSRVEKEVVQMLDFPDLTNNNQTSNIKQ